MPITPAHAAAVVPLRLWKRCFWLSPLVVGSLAPDFPYYVFPPPSLRHFGHTFSGLLLFCIPVGLAVLYAFHRHFKRPLALLLPQPLRAKLWPYCGPFPLLPLRRLAWIAALIYLGAVTHVVWDGFTHENDWALREYPRLSAVMTTVAGQELHWVGLLQHGSSVLGLGLLAWWSWQWYRRAPAASAPADSEFFRQARLPIATAIIALAAGVGTLCGLSYACRLPGPFKLREFLASAFITGVDAFGLALLVFVVAVNVRDWRAARMPHAYRLLRDLSGTPRRQNEQ